MSRTALEFSESLVGLRRVPPRSNVDGEGRASDSRAKIDALRQASVQKQERHDAEQELTQALLATLSTLREDVRTRLDATRDWVLDVALGLAAHVLDKEIEDGRYDLGKVLRDSLDAAMSADGGIDINVASIDEGFAREWLERDEAESPDTDAETEIKRRCSLRVDPSLLPGSCRVSTSIGQVVHSPTEALARVAQSVREGLVS